MRATIARAWRPALRTAAVLLCAPAALAVTTETWVREGDTLRAGTVEGMVITPEGLLVPGPRAEVLARPETGVLWGVLATGNVVLAAGGEKTGVLRIVNGKAEPVAATTPAIDAPVAGVPVASAAGQPAPAHVAGQEVFALAEGKDGAVYAGTGPGGALYRIDPATRAAREVWKPGATYIWAILPLPDGALAVATGLPGRVVRVDPRSGAATTVWESTDPHVRSLALSREGKILAGTSGTGLLLELDGKGGAFTLWDSERPEAVAIAVDGKGTIWAAFAGAPGRGTTDTTPSPSSPRPPARGGNLNITVKPRAGGDDEATVTAKVDDEKTTELPRAGDTPGSGGSLVRIGAGEEPETAWSDAKESPMALAAKPEGGVLLGTANPAHIWWLDGAGHLGLFDERKENRAVSGLYVRGDRVWAALSNPAAVVGYGPGPASPARWTSDVMDAKVRARLGRLRAVTEANAAGRYTVLVRVGNTSEPGPGWTGWTEAPGAAGPPDGPGGAFSLPLARFFQVRVETRPEAPAAPGAARVEPRPAGAGVSGVALRYRTLNRAPKVDSVEILPQGVALRSIPPPQMSGGEVPVVPPPRGPELERALGESSPPWRSKRAWEPNAITVTWTGRDPDNDELRYRLEYCVDRGGTCGTWVPLADDLDQSFFSFDSRTLPDGIYRFRVTATDEPGNAVGEGRTTSQVSDPVAIDNQPPAIDTAQYTRRADGRVDLAVTAHDTGGRIARAEVAREPGRFLPLAPADGVDDGRQETWSATLPAPAPGAVLLVRVTDAAGNSSTRRAEEK